MRIEVVIAALSLSLLTALPAAEPELAHPLIRNHGGIFPLPDAAEQPAKGAKVVLDVTSEAEEMPARRTE